MIFFKKIFSKKSNEESIDSTYNLKQKIEDEINACNKEKDDIIRSIDEMKKWSKDIILEIFNVPKEFWYEEIKNYEKIKTLSDNQTINQILISQTDEIINGYTAQIKIKEAKLKFTEKIIIEYQLTKLKLEKIQQKNIVSEKEKKQLAMLNKHKKNIANMKNENLSGFSEKKDELFHFSNDIKSIEDEFNFRQELQNQIEEIHNIANKENYDVNFIENEIKKLTQNLNS